MPTDRNPVALYRAARERVHLCPRCLGNGMFVGGPLGVYDCADCAGTGRTRVTRTTALRAALGLLSDSERNALTASAVPSDD